MSDQPLLSICIPTYNRSGYLNKTIESIVRSDGFNERDVEVIVSDNASTDGTERAVSEWTARYSNIKYYKNAENIKDRNFPIALGRASGQFRKLHNDTLIFNQGALQTMLSLLREHAAAKPVLFFLNQRSGVFHATSIEEFLKKISFQITWIGGFGVWEDSCEGISDCFTGCDESLWQVPFLLNTCAGKDDFVAAGFPFFTQQTVSKKDISYGLYQVFYVNYLGFIKQQLEKGFISKECYDDLEKDLLFNFFPYWLYQFEIQNKQLVYSDKEDLLALVLSAYKDKEYYKEFLGKYNLLKLKEKIKRLVKPILRKNKIR